LPSQYDVITVTDRGATAATCTVSVRNKQAKPQHSHQIFSLHKYLFIACECEQT
jgi:hypothetical protein